MEKNFNNREFEQFVKQNADQYRIFPSEKVWNGIHNTLHTRRKWYGIGLALLIFTATAVTLVMVNSAERKQEIASSGSISSSSVAHPKATQPVQKTALIVPAKSVAKNRSSNGSLPNYNQPSNIFISDLASNPVDENFTTPTAEVNAEIIVTATTQPAILPVATPARNKPVVTKKPDNLLLIAVSSNHQNKPSVPATTIKEEENAAPDKNTLALNKTDMYPLTIESVVNSYTHIRKPKKLSWEIFVTPTISYRKLKENRPFLDAARAGATGTLIAMYTPDINSIVIHKPDIGFQLGFTAGYPLSKSLTITGGLQFNASKYDIRVYNSPSEVATIALSNSPGGSNTVSAYTNYRNIGGYKAEWLHNLYFSASAPVGLELKLTHKKRSYVGVGATIQPTYTLGNRAYLISTDFKNYAEIPSLTRKWNVNTGFELFAATTTGKVQWRVGPQVRYQTMSSFVEKYPIKEHLFDFGLKLGIMLK